MVDLTEKEAKNALISMTKDGMIFDGKRGLTGGDGEPQGALVFKKDGDDFRSAYTKIAKTAGYGEVGAIEVRDTRTSETTYEILNKKLVADMCGYCKDLGRGRS